MICDHDVAWPWPCGDVPGDDGDLAGRVHTHRRALPASGRDPERVPGDVRRHEPAHLDPRRKAAAEQLAPRRRLLTAGLERGLVVAQLEQLVERLCVVARVVHEADRGGERELGGEVAPAHLGAGDAELLGQDVHHPLDGEGRLGPARAAQGVGRDRVRVDVGDLDVDLGDGVGAGGHQQRELRDQRRQHLQVGAVVLDVVHAHAEHLAVAGSRKLHVRGLGAAVAGGDHRLGALLDPLHRRTDLLRRRRGDELLGVGVQLGAEPAADVRGDRAHLGLADPAHDREERAQEVGHLGGAVDDQVVGGRVPVGHHAARLDGDVDQALASDRLLDDDVGLRERVVDAVGLVGEDEPDVGLELLVHARRAVGEGRVDVDDRRELRIGDLDGVGGVTRGVAVCRDHDRDRLADVAYAPLRERWAHRMHHVAGRVRRAGNARRELEVVAVQDGGDARHAAGGRRVDRGDVGMRILAAHDRHVQHPRQLDVVHVAAAPGEELAVLLAQRRDADALRAFHGGRHYAVTPAAARTAATMFS